MTGRHGLRRPSAMAGQAEKQPARNAWVEDESLLSNQRSWDEDMAVPTAFGMSLSSEGESASEGWEEEGDSFAPFAGSDTGSEPDHLPDLVRQPQWYSWMMAQADQSDSECSLFTDVQSQTALDHLSETEFSEPVDKTSEQLSYSTDMFSPQKTAGEPPNISARAIQRDAEMPWPGPTPQQWEDSTKARAARQESVVPHVPPTRGPGVKAERASAGPEPACPVCNRPCKEPHRLGVYWRKFGYTGAFYCVSHRRSVTGKALVNNPCAYIAGPPYCNRCAGAFRAHMLTCTVLPETCNRESPCTTCGILLAHFDRPHKQLFAHMDASQPSSRCIYARPGRRKEETRPPCPLCFKTDHGGLGVFWKKFGYDGPAYCTLCSSGFRNHIIRQRKSRSPCSRDTPCDLCSKILGHFSTDRAASYAAIDAHSPTSKAAPCGAQIKSEPGQDLKPSSQATVPEGTGQKRPASALGQGSSGSWSGRKQSKDGRLMAAACLIGMVAISLIFNGWFPLHTEVLVPSVDSSHNDAALPEPPRNATSCSGGDVKPHMNKVDLDNCVGEQGDMCYVGCDTGFTLVGEMKCDMGKFHGAFCVPSQSGAPGCSGAGGLYYQQGGQSFSPLYTHFNWVSLNDCAGDVGDICDFRCETGTSARHSYMNSLSHSNGVLSILLV